MKLKIYSLYDSKAKAYTNPFYQRTNGEALRSFETAANDPQTDICRFASDFTLYEIGEWDCLSGTITQDVKNCLGTGLEYKKDSPQPSHIHAQN